MSLFKNLGKEAVQEELPKANPAAVQESKKAEPSVLPTEERSKPTVVLTELDSYLHEVISSQPSTVEEAVSHIVSLAEEGGLHRLSLPEYFEKMSYDCTRGSSCQHHTKQEIPTVAGKTFKITNPGKFVFRWVMKDKRAIDSAKNVRGWSVVSRTMADFRDAPCTLFSAHGGMEIGDALLVVMPVERAMKLRRFPGDISRERLRGQMTPSKSRPGKVMMTGNPEAAHIYEPASTTSSEEEEEVSGAPPGGIEFQEGRDF